MKVVHIEFTDNIQMEKAKEIRYKVFVLGQKCPNSDNYCWHLCLLLMALRNKRG